MQQSQKRPHTFENEKMLMTWGPETQQCCRPSYTKCSYVLSTTSQVPASRHSLLVRSSSSLLIMMPARQSAVMLQGTGTGRLCTLCREISRRPQLLQSPVGLQGLTIVTILGGSGP